MTWIYCARNDNLEMVARTGVVLPRSDVDLAATTIPILHLNDDQGALRVDALCAYYRRAHIWG